MLIDHLPGKYKDTLACYDMWEHQDWEDRDEETGELLGFVSYFFLDMMIAAAKNNRFSPTQFKIVINTIRNRVKPIRLQSDPTNKALCRIVTKYGGRWLDDEMIFD